MSRARDLADLLDASGDVKSAALDNVPASNDASALTTGTLDMARVANGSVTNAHFASGAADLSHDTTPQLGGNLDAQENIIASASRLQVGRQSITNAYSATSNGYVADFQGHSSSGQTYISIAAPNVATLGDGGTILGEDQTDTYLYQRTTKHMKFGTDDTTRMIINGSAGYVTMPYQPFFQLEHPTNTSITISANSYINLTYAIANHGNHVNSSGTFTAPVAGVYGLYWKMIVAGNTANIHTSFIFSAGSHGGTNYHFTPTTGNWESLVMSGYYYMPQGCTVRVYNHSVAWTGHGGSWSHFSGYLVG